FFFSSRRRHTRSKRDWSSDVCSSDLELSNLTQVNGSEDSCGTQSLMKRFQQFQYLLKKIFFILLVKGNRISLQDRKSTRLNSSHVSSSYAVFCLKKKNHPERVQRGVQGC